MTAPSSLILASASPRRRQLLALGGWSFAVLAADVDEMPHPDEPPGDYVLRLAAEKARAVAAGSPQAWGVVAADTTVVDGGQILGKPANAAEAEAMLRQLRGRTHQVLTGIAVLRLADGLLKTELAATDVPMRAYSDGEMHAYIASGDPFDKAGGYAIQHPEFRPVDALSGCYANVVGLPLCHLTRLLTGLGLPPRADVPAACQPALEYDCPVFSRILEGTL
ncbi:MAG: septum formation protein Maf [Anaerolineae bacterium]|nr:MAG: septum formation protein Maf [Anaerolineae bacterium]